MLQKLYFWYGKRTVQTIILAVFLLICVGLYFALTQNGTDETAEEAVKKTVSVKRVSDLSFSNSFSSVGTVEAISEAKLQTEAGGRIVSVSTDIGKMVSAGSVLATLENAAEQASLLQAQGAYEAALTSSASGEVGVAGATVALANARKNAITTYQSAFITVEGALHNTVDDYFTVENGIASGFKLDAKGKAVSLNDRRTAVDTVFQQWEKERGTATEENIKALYTQALQTTKQIGTFTEELATIAQEQDIVGSDEIAQKDADIANIATARVSINGVWEALDARLAQIDASEKALEQAKLAGAQELPSASNAQLKIALGNLRSAQATYEKTLVRTPISGVVNALYLKVGEYASPGSSAAVVANNNGLQISTSVSEEESAQIKIGDEVRINNSATGTITAIAGAVDPNTGKVQVKVSVSQGSDLSNGTTATIEYTQESASENKQIVISISALKMTGSGPIAFEVIDGKLKALPLTLGEIHGDTVEVISGLTYDSNIVEDSRGLKDGQEVEVTPN